MVTLFFNVFANEDIVQMSVSSQLHVLLQYMFHIHDISVSTHIINVRRHALSHNSQLLILLLYQILYHILDDVPLV